MLRRTASVVALLVCAVAQAQEPPPIPSFRVDVMAALSKAGCNLGVCHGNKYGKGGFKLSLRGDDPAGDFAVLTRDLSARRANPLEPERSLLLLKPTMQVPHEGGRRFRIDSPEYEILSRWIGAGMPADPPELPTVAQLLVEPAEVFLKAPADSTKITAIAVFSDGTTRDVARQATYELSSPIADVDAEGRIYRRDFGEVTLIVRYVDRQAPVRIAFVPERPGFVWSAAEPEHPIDRFVYDKLQRLEINPSPICSDTVFVRRAYLDLLGTLPTADEARAFVGDRTDGKRSRLIDALLDRPEYAEFWALKWGDLLRNEEKTLDRKGVEAFHAWIRNGIATGKPLDVFVRELIASRGSTYGTPASNYWRAMREPFMRAESTAQVFLGVRLQCAKCHNHPFDRWSQDDYYGWSNLFSRVQYRVLENRRRDSNDSHEFNGEQLVVMARTGDVVDPRNEQPPAPRFLEKGSAALPEDADRLLALAEWLTRPDNRAFVDAQVNRIWFHLMGQGIVDPIDDFRGTNPPSHPELLRFLSDDFVAHKFDVRHLIRTIMNSRTYQASSEAHDGNRDDHLNFSRAKEQRLSAEVLVDALSRATGAPVSFSGYPRGTRGIELSGVRLERGNRPTKADQFLSLFGKPPRLQSCECERASDPTLSQTFQLVSGELMNDLLTHRACRVTRMISEQRPDADCIDELYWSTLSRPPTDEERQATTLYLQNAADRRRGLEDLLWGLLNSHEFLLRR
jgi:hypothetical protein